MAAALHDWAQEAQRSCGGRVARAETIHLTLAFLGDVQEKFLPDLKSVSVTGERHLLPIEGSRYWPHNRIVWVGPRATPSALEVLVSSLVLTLGEKGFRTESRRFSAHITLIRKARDPGTLPAVPAVSWPVAEFVLVRSRLASEGSGYEILERFPLS